MQESDYISKIQDLYHECDFEEVYKYCNDLIQKYQNNYDINYYLSASAFHIKDKNTALIHSKKILEINPNIIEGYLLRIDILEYTNDFEAKLECCDLATKYNLHHDKLITTKIHSLITLNRQAEVLTYINILEKDKLLNQEIIHLNMALALYKSAKYNDAIIEIDEALQINNKNPLSHSLKSDCFIAKKELPKAIKYSQKAISLNNSDVTYITKLASIYCMQGNIEKEHKLYKKYKKKFINNKSFLIAYSQSLFKEQKFNEAISINNIRSETIFFKKIAVKHIQIKEDIKDNFIVIYEKEGIGDNINYLRFYKTLLEYKPKKIVLFTISKKRNIFHELIKNNSLIKVADEDECKEADYYIDMTALPFLFIKSDKDIPHNINLFEHIKYKNIISIDKTKLNIGFVWRGQIQHRNDNIRSIFDLSIFEKLFSIDNSMFYSLQYENNNDLNTYKSNTNIVDCEPLINNIYDTLNIIRDLDIIITVDTSIAHLSATIDKPTLLLISTCNDWRWFKGTNTSPWYDSLKIFRQKEVNNWKNVIDNVYDFIVDFKTTLK